MNEEYYDTLLNIKTAGNQKGFNNSLHYHRYEPTPYHALDLLFQQYELKSSDHVVDFGCGKGRLVFYINHRFNASAVGIDMNETLYQQAMENRINYLKKTKKDLNQVHFLMCFAEEYEIDPSDNRFYFFNPFSIQVFINIINKILVSVENVKREVELVLYYPSEDYIFFLENQTLFELKMEIKLSGKFANNPNERFLIYQLSY
ncbi:methyltransferase domain-containing protein [Peribacillus alkalitolerans]|uniref:methyltransferase domain-containing protein n=1 Tax=Peribacillus alkalitolerans TaxID=1550385 RepID=UPI0013D09670|nr:methyltransferase domain-containing protein [Peribacillus alkalitolerans]